MSPIEKNIQELKLTAAVYASQKDWLQHVKETGKLPENQKPRPWLGIAANHIIRERGRDITLTPDEQLIYDALLKEKRLPGGSVTLLPEPDEK